MKATDFGGGMATVARADFGIDADLLSASMMHSSNTQTKHYVSVLNDAQDRKLIVLFEF